jgi:hypothetical protein
VRYEPDGSLCTASVEQIFPRDGVQRNCFELGLYITTASPIAPVRVFETALPTLSVRDQRDHRAEPSSVLGICFCRSKRPAQLCGQIPLNLSRYFGSIGLFTSRWRSRTNIQIITSASRVPVVIWSAVTLTASEPFRVLSPVEPPAPADAAYRDYAGRVQNDIPDACRRSIGPDTGLTPEGLLRGE